MKKKKAEATIYVLMLFTEQDVCSVACSSISEVVDVLRDDVLINSDYHDDDNIIVKNKSTIRKFVIDVIDYGANFDYNNLVINSSEDDNTRHLLADRLFQIDSHKVKLEVKLARR